MVFNETPSGWYGVCLCVCVGGAVNAWQHLATQLQTFLTLDASYIVAVIEKRYRQELKQNSEVQGIFICNIFCLSTRKKKHN